MGKQNIYWIKTGETFGGQGVGADITEYFEGDLDKKGEVIEGSRLEELQKDGKVGFEKPLTPEIAGEQELNQLRATIQEHVERISELEHSAKSKKGGTSKKAAAEIAKLEDQAIDWELKVDYLTEMVNVMEPDWKPSKDGK